MLSLHLLYIDKLAEVAMKEVYVAVCGHCHHSLPLVRLEMTERYFWVADTDNLDLVEEDSLRYFEISEKVSVEQLLIQDQDQGVLFVDRNEPHLIGRSIGATDAFLIACERAPRRRIFPTSFICEAGTEAHGRRLSISWFDHSRYTHEIKRIDAREILELARKGKLEILDRNFGCRWVEDIAGRPSNHRLGPLENNELALSHWLTAICSAKRWHECHN